MNLGNKINERLRELGSDVVCDQLPRDLPEYSVLKGKKIVIVDDLLRVAERLLPELMVATGGTADAVIQGQDMTMGGILRQVMDIKPDYVLMDRNLIRVRGADVVTYLSMRRPDIKCIGFSSENGFEKEFKEAGAIASVLKRPESPEECIKDLAKVLKKIG